MTIRKTLLMTIAAILAAAAVARADGGGTVAFLGIAAQPADAAASTAAGVPEGVGLTVTFVEPAGPAAVGHGVRAGDLLHKLDDQLLVNVAQMATLVQLHKPGEPVTLTVVRDGQPIQVTVKLGGRQRPATPPPLPPPVANGGDDEKIPTLPGIVGPDPVTGRIPDDFQLPVPPITSAYSVSYSDGTYSARVTKDAAGHKQMVVKNAEGKEVARGPVDTPDQWNAFPADIRQHLATVQKLINGGNKVTVHTSGHHAHVSVQGNTTQP